MYGIDRQRTVGAARVCGGAGVRRRGWEGLRECPGKRGGADVRKRAGVRSRAGSRCGKHTRFDNAGGYGEDGKVEASLLSTSRHRAVVRMERILPADRGGWMKSSHEPRTAAVVDEEALVVAGFKPEEQARCTAGTASFVVEPRGRHTSDHTTGQQLCESTIHS